MKVKNGRIEQAMFGAGCFWGVELMFSKIEGVLKATSGYSGGHMRNPTYEQVCSDKSGHAEVVHIEFDPSKVSYEKLLDIFWKNHNPTTINMQGPDVGTQYRSVIFYYDEEQKKKAMKSKEEYQKKLDKKIVTNIEKAQEFYPAEEYHQRYLEKHGQTSCHINY